MSFSIKKDKPVDSRHLKLPTGDPAEIAIQPRGSMLFNPTDGFVYISDGAVWDRISGVNNPVDNLLPVTRHKVAKWVDDYPPGGVYTTPVLQDSSLDIDDDGNATLNDTGNGVTQYPWSNANLMVHGSVATSYTYGMGLDPADPTVFVPVMTQCRGSVPEHHREVGLPSNTKGSLQTLVRGVSRTSVSSSSGNVDGERPTASQIDQIVTDPKPRDRLENGSIAVGYGAMESVVSSSIDPVSQHNTAVGVRAMRICAPFEYKAVTHACSGNTVMGFGAMEGTVENPVTGDYNVVMGAYAMERATDASHCVCIGTNSTVNKHTTGSVVVGSESKCWGDGNVVVGGSSTDGSHTSVVVLGSDIEAQGSNRLVLGSGITVVPQTDRSTHNVGQYRLAVQIGNKTWYVPLMAE